MSKPCRVDCEKITPIGKILNSGLRHMKQVFPFGMDDGVICVYSDSNWAVISPENDCTVIGGS